MKTKVILAASALLIAAACSSKKATTSTASNTSSTSSSEPLVLLKPSDGIYPPGNEELAAIQTKYADVTLEQLKQGHLIYTEGACVNCHGAMNIYKRAEADWKGIIDDMAEKAKISAEQKDAVYKYVLAIKATQPK